MKRASIYLLLVAVAAISASSVPGAEAACTGASPTWTSSPDRDSVNSCIAKAASGDTIRVSAGRANWSGGGITLNKSVKIIGAGNGCPGACDDATTILVGAGTAISATASNWRVSGLTFEGPGSAGGAIYINAGGAASAVDWRIDHCHFKGTTGRGISVGAYASEAGYEKDFPGLIDSNRFSAPNRFKAVQVYGGSRTAHGSWDEPLVLGGASFVFIEDNHFVHTAMPDGVSSIDGDTGARYVIRYNSFTNGDISAHGVETCADIATTPVCGWKSTHGWEIYGNSFAYDTAHSFVMNIRGGTGVAHSNQVTGTSMFPPMRYLYERGDITRTCLKAGACQGLSPFDRNQPGRYGYMCWQQIGATGSNGTTSMPAYQWANAYNGVPDESSLTGVTFEAGCGDQHVQIGRDVVLLDAGSSGPLVARPTRCRTGEAYWATDQGEWNARHPGPDGQLYKCAAPNSWTQYYRPYKYPYTVQNPPAAPMSLRIR